MKYMTLEQVLAGRSQLDAETQALIEEYPDGMTPESIGITLGVTAQYVRKLEEQAMSRIMALHDGIELLPATHSRLLVAADALLAEYGYVTKRMLRGETSAHENVCAKWLWQMWDAGVLECIGGGVYVEVEDAKE